MCVKVPATICFRLFWPPPTITMNMNMNTLLQVGLITIETMIKHPTTDEI